MADNQAKKKAWECVNTHRLDTTANLSNRSSRTAGPTRGFVRDHLPDPVSYYENQGLQLKGPRMAPWRTAECRFHGGSDSMRIKVATGAFRCMACEAKGGDVLAFHMAMYGLDFIQAARALGAWSGDREAQQRQVSPSPLTARDALQVIGFEVELVAIAAGNLAKGVALTQADRVRVMVAAGRINHVARAYL